MRAILLCLWAGLSAAASDPLFIHTYFTGSGQCAVCHNDLVDNSGQDISIERAWSTSMMAQAARDPYWQAKVASELKRNPALADEINATCSRCHMPMANDTAHKQDEEILILDTPTKKGYTNPAHPYYNLAMDGVSCTLCHQIKNNADFGEETGDSGGFEIADYILEGGLQVDRPIYGQYSQPVTNPMRNAVQFTPTYSPHISDSALCGSCHDLRTPYIGSDGQIGKDFFAEQMVYSEWLHSAFSQKNTDLFASCQDCHMPKLDQAVPIANHPFNLGNRPDFAQHDFIGANTVMLDLINRYRDELGVQATGFEQAMAKTQSFLQKAASIQIQSYELEADRLQVRLKVSNLSGHKFPSGYPSRRAYIHFIARDESGKILFESGALNRDGSIRFVNSDMDYDQYEPHYESIDSETQVQVYEPIMGDDRGQVNHTLLRSAQYLKDNRLLPIGFDPETAPAKIAVYGRAAEDDDFQAGSDQIEYEFNIGSAAQVSISAELHYQPLAYGHLQNLFADAELSEVSRFQRMLSTDGLIRDELIDTDQKTIMISIDPECSDEQIELSGTIEQNMSCRATEKISADFELLAGFKVYLNAPLIELKPGLLIHQGAELQLGSD